ncbi:MAG: flippase activity-associated protein Agl23 [Candidatus Limnocylindrales bacterium]
MSPEGATSGSATSAAVRAVRAPETGEAPVLEAPSEAAAGPTQVVAVQRWRAWAPWAAALLVLVAVAAALLLWNLPLAPFHNDEGVNGWFTHQLLQTGTWRYDPANYHGPTLFYAEALSGLLVGLSEVSMRLVPAVFGLATLGLALLTWRWIGRIGALAAAALLAVSPGMVFFSRYAIHEMLLVCFTLAFVLAAARWWETARERYLLGAAAALALMFATKETAIITAIVLLLAAGCLIAYERYAASVLGRRLDFGPRPGTVGRSATGGRPRGGRSAPADPMQRFGGRTQLVFSLVKAAGVFLAIWIVLFSSLFTNIPGLADSLRSLTIWTQTSGATQVSGPLTYVGWMAQEEPTLLVIGLAGSAWVAWEGRSRFAIFAAAWATGLLLAYSLIGYKTPWLILNWLVPYALVAGYAIRRAWTARRRALQIAVAVVLALSLPLSAAKAVQLAFSDYDAQGNAYVYVQTQRSILDLVAWLRAEDDRQGAHGQLGVVIMSPDYWPLPWYLRDDHKAGFYGQVVDVAAPVQIVKEEQLGSLPAAFSTRYREQARYTLRPGVVLVVFAAVHS